jgi:GT2 family glycosyltransferase
MKKNFSAKRQISIIITTWNSAPHLPRCLDSLENQTYQNFEIIIIDNGSTDGGVNGIQEKHPELNICIKKLDTNTGFAVANNIGARMARGEWLALLNADAFPEPVWLENLLRAAKQYPHASFASRQIQENSPDFLDGEGDVYHISGLAWRRGYNEPIYHTENIEEIFSPCAAAALYPRQAFLDVGGFDKDYFAYHEDVDLGFRLRLYGVKSYYVPQAIVLHIRSASTGKLSDFVVYYGHRNLVWTYLKNMPWSLFWLYLPLYLFMNLYFLLSFSVKGRGKVIRQAKTDAIKEFRKIWCKRKCIQSNRVASTMQIYKALERNIFALVKASLARRCSKDKNGIGDE